MGYVPYFHIANNNVNLTSSLKAKLTGKEVFYDKLLQDSCPRDLRLSSILQNNDFEFNQFGVSGESITAVSMAGSSAPMEHEVIELNVDRPFYAIAEKTDFPSLRTRSWKSIKLPIDSVPDKRILCHVDKT
jgi:hypothetical protein